VTVASVVTALTRSRLVRCRFRLYEEGPVVKQRFGLAVVKDCDKSGVERSSSLYRLLFEGPGFIGARPGGAIPKRAV